MGIRLTLDQELSVRIRLTQHILARSVMGTRLTLDQELSVRIRPSQQIGRLCNGSTSSFDLDRPGSNPGRPTRYKFR